jgi:hypothetical protein
MNRHTLGTGRTLSVVLTALTVLGAVEASAQCPVTELTSGLQFPLGITQSHQGNLLVSETGTLGVLHSGRISILDRYGHRRTLLDGLPSATNDVNEPAGPAGVFMRGRTLYVAIGIGDTIQAVETGSIARIANPHPSSPVFSSILAIHFSAAVEKITAGFSLATTDHQALANGEKLKLSNGDGDRIAIELIAKFPDFTPNPLPTLAANVRGVNPFDLVGIGDQLYVTDGGQNLLWQVDIPSRGFSVLTTFPNIANPLFNPTPPPPSLGGPIVEAVPTGIREFNGQLFVTLFRGFPFPPGTSVVEQIDPATGNHVPFITGLKTAIDVLPLTDDGETTDYLVLQHASGPVLSGPGLLMRVQASGGPPIVIANCLNRPTSMTRDEKTGALFVSEIVNGRVVVIP